MTTQLKIKLLFFSIGLSLVSISTSIYINYEIAEAYLEVDRKTKLLFDIVESVRFSYQYYFVIISIISLLLALIGNNGTHSKTLKVISLMLSLLANTIVFLRLWRLLVFKHLI